MEGEKRVAARLDIVRVERVEERTLQEGRVVRLSFCQGRIDGREGAFAVQLWSHDGGESFDGEEQVREGNSVEGAQPRNAKFRVAMGVPVFDWMESARRRTGPARQYGGGLGGLAGVGVSWLAEWVADRKEARALARERFEFEKRAKAVELTIAAMGVSHKEELEFEKVMGFILRKLEG